MKFGVLGSGDVGQAIGGKLLSLGHEVMMGSRSPDNEKAVAWASEHRARNGTFADAASFGEILVNCTSGGASLAALELAGATNLSGKILIDISNPLDFSKGFPPRLSISNDDSLGEAIQRAYPDVKVVKSLNTISNPIMVDPLRLGTEHVVFVSGNDAAAKSTVTELLRSFGWQNIVDFGDISFARATEQWMAMWTRLYATLGSADFNIAIVRPKG